MRLALTGALCYTLPMKFLDHPIIQGPLAGYSAAPFRRLIWEHSKPMYCTTEMISAKDLRHRKQNPRRFLHRDPAEQQLCYQLSGNDADDLAYATEIVSQLGADIIDLNCGCPKPKIRKKNCGTKLLTDPELLHQLISAIKHNTHAFVSIKIRVASPINDHDDMAVIDAAESAGVDFITVHGRHWTQGYDTDCQIEAIRKIKIHARVPIVANGDVDNFESLINMLKNTGCDAVMIARATLGRPWLIKKIKAHFANDTFAEPSSEAIGDMFKQHLLDLIQLDGEHLAILQSRKLAKYYARNCENPASFTDRMQHVNSINEALKFSDDFFNR
jgi:tRNA-dihydrouridine synthase B